MMLCQSAHSRFGKHNSRLQKISHNLIILGNCCKTGTELSSAFTMLVKAVAFIFPQCWEEFSEYQNFIAEMFISYQPSFHSQIIQFDQAIQNKISTQWHICLTDTAQFDALCSTYLSSHGVGPNLSESSSETQGAGKQ